MAPITLKSIFASDQIVTQSNSVNFLWIFIKKKTSQWYQADHKRPCFDILFQELVQKAVCLMDRVECCWVMCSLYQVIIWLNVLKQTLSLPSHPHSAA